MKRTYREADLVVGLAEGCGPRPSSFCSWWQWRPMHGSNRRERSSKPSSATSLGLSSLSSKTMRRHVDNLWILGGEIIRDLNYTPSLRKVAAQRLLREAVHADGGPLIHNGSEEEQHSLDATCRKLHRFLSQPQR